MGVGIGAIGFGRPPCDLIRRSSSCANVHTVHTVPDFGLAGGRLGTVLSPEIFDRIAGLTQVPLAALCDKVINA